MLLRATIELAIDCAQDLPALAAWWRDHQHALRHLSDPDLAAVVAIKDHRKRLLEQHSYNPSPARPQPCLI